MAQTSNRGLSADTPTEIPAAGWWEILKRVYVKTGNDNIGLLAAGVAFYAFLAFVPLLGALIMTYGLIADPSKIADDMKTVIDLVPADAARLIYDQLISLSTSAAGKKGLGLAIALLVSIYGAMRAASGIMMALNVIYEQPEKRSIIRTTAISALITIGAVVVAIVGLLSASVLAFLETVFWQLGGATAFLIKLATWLFAGGLAAFGIAMVYRIGPDRHDAKWRWLSMGSIVATLLWVAATVGFGIYASKFGDYNATYGSLGAVVVLLMWLFVSSYAILLGAELNAESERQTSRDSTTGPEKPLGTRGATVADTLPPKAG
ncbi:MAG: Ribonuclease [Sphingomonas bacterium]|nr:YihY/virulence factor BrkB family protein [Sphingomonas bacterium]MDB5689281.1 Ribonuclease [Sphingomonas bacterium]